MIKCENCGIAIGEYITDFGGSKGAPKTSKFNDTARVCNHCKGELCVSCYIKSDKCPCCGKGGQSA